MNIWKEHLGDINMTKFFCCTHYFNDINLQKFIESISEGKITGECYFYRLKVSPFAILAMLLSVS